MAAVCRPRIRVPWVNLLPLSIVQAAPRSDAARAKDKTKQTEEGFPVHSFRTLLADLGTLAKNRVSVANRGSLCCHLRN